MFICPFRVFQCCKTKSGFWQDGNEGHFIFLPTFLNGPEYALIVVYDITQRRSFEEAKELVHRLAEFAFPWAFPWSRPFVFGALVGNKADLEDRREVSFEVSNVAMFM